jgi:hypothetical protein
MPARPPFWRRCKNAAAKEKRKIRVLEDRNSTTSVTTTLMYRNPSSAMHNKSKKQRLACGRQRIEERFGKLQKRKSCKTNLLGIAKLVYSEKVCVCVGGGCKARMPPRRFQEALETERSAKCSTTRDDALTRRTGQRRPDGWRAVATIRGETGDGCGIPAIIS